MRVSELLILHEAVLDVLIEHGFAPLTQTRPRSLLAPTVEGSGVIREGDDEHVVGDAA